jgi:hypothetical protein
LIPVITVRIDPDGIGAAEKMKPCLERGFCVFGALCRVLCVSYK